MSTESYTDDHSVGQPTSVAQVAFVVVGSQEDEFAALRQLGERLGAHKLESLASAQRELERDPDLHLVISYPDPARSLASMLSAPNQDGSDPLQEWKKRTARVTELFRKFRRRISLVNGHHAIRNPAQLAERLQRRTGLDMRHHDSAAPALGASTDPLALAVAQALLNWDEKASRLMEELVTSSLPLPPPASPAADELLQAFHFSEVGTGAQVASTEQQEENELLVLQLRQLQEELEANFLRNRKLEQQLKDVSSQVEGRELEQAREKLKQLERDIEAIRTSLSWRATEPFRKAIGVLKGGSGR